MFDYVQVKRSLEERRRHAIPFKCWCRVAEATFTNDRENVVRLRAKYEDGNRCAVCMGV